MADSETLARREAVRHILRTTRVGTQEDLRARLLTRGFDVTQATLSRDLSRLRARRVTVPDEGSIYEIDSFAASDGHGELARLRDVVTGIEESVALVVVMTATGAASSVALALDRARLPEALGTIAGDDTIFVAPARASSAAAVAKKLRKIWKKGGS
jgi:transcriptional regulator of arginine metabolism